MPHVLITVHLATKDGFHRWGAGILLFLHTISATSIHRIPIPRMQKCDSIIDPRHKHLLGRNLEGEKTPSSTLLHPSITSRKIIIITIKPLLFSAQIQPRTLLKPNVLHLLEPTHANVSGRRWLLLILRKLHFPFSYLFFQPRRKDDDCNRWVLKTLDPFPFKSFINNPISQCLDRQRRVNFEFDALRSGSNCQTCCCYYHICISFLSFIFTL